MVSDPKVRLKEQIEFMKMTSLITNFIANLFFLLINVYLTNRIYLRINY